MPWKSRWTIDIPTLSLPDYVFTSPTAPLSSQALIIDAERPKYQLSHHDYREWSKRLAIGLQKAGFRPGDRLLLYSSNTIFFPVVLMGTIMAGGIFSGANPAYVPRELAYQLQDSGAAVLVTAASSLDTALEAAASVQFSRDRMFIFDDGYATFDGTGQSVQGVAHWSGLLASPADAAAFRWESFATRAAMDRTAVLNYSSGTTGVPKGVEITHMNYISNCMQLQFMQELDPAYEERSQRAVGLSFLPMYHAYGQSMHCIMSATRGTPVYVMRRFDFVKMLQYIERYRVTNLTLVPPIAVALTKRPEVRGFDLRSIEGAGCGAAPLGKESADEFDRAVTYGQYQLRQGWGMTEITCSAMGWDPRRPSRPGSVGELNPNVEAMIVDDDGREVAPGQRGELWVRGPNVMKGYWRKPEATRDTKTPDGWLKTGDIAYRDEEYLIYVVDRKKELIKVKGNQVAPAELEALLIEHPAVQDAAVVGVVINGEELPRAYLVLQGSATTTAATTGTTADEVVRWLAAKVTPYKRLAGGAVVTDSIPKNPSGKILRKLLRDRAEAEAAAEADNGKKVKQSRRQSRL